MPVAAPIAAGAASAVVGSALSKGNKGGTTTAVQNSAPWIGAQSYLNDAFRQAQGVFYNGSPISYSADGGPGTPVPFSGIHGQGVEQLGATIRGDYLNPSSNPFLGQYVNDALGQVKSNFAGQYGGAAGGNLGNSGYQEMLTRTLANTALPIYANAYNTERQNQLNATQLAGSYQFAPLQAYTSILNGAGGGTTTTQQPYFTNPAAGALGMGLAGAQIYGALNQPGPQASYVPEMAPGQYSLMNPAYG